MSAQARVQPMPSGYLRRSLVGLGLLAWALVPLAQAAPGCGRYELNGYLLGQHRAAVVPRLGEPFMTKSVPPLRYEAFGLDEASNTYMVFGFEAEGENQRAVVLQLTGGPSETVEHSFGGLKLGASAAEVLAVLGPPEEESDVAEIGGRLWAYYERCNFSIELGPDGRLYSIRLKAWRGLEPSDIKSSGDPDFARFRAAVVGRDIEALMRLLMPDVEIFRDGRAFGVDRGLRDALTDEDAPLRRVLFADDSGLAGLLRDHPNPDDGAVRVWEKDAGRVDKFSRGAVSEVVYKWQPGGWRVWEVYVGPPKRPYPVDEMVIETEAEGSTGQDEPPKR